MGVDPQIEDVMARMPRRPGERAIDGPMVWGIVWTGLSMTLVTLLTIDLYLHTWTSESASPRHSASACREVQASASVLSR